MLGYYDYVLGLIPLALIGLTGLLQLAGLPTTMALPVGAGVAVALMGHAMFVRSPVTTGRAPPTESSRPPRLGNAD